MLRKINGAQRPLLENLFKTKDLETTLSYLRRLMAVLEGDEKVGPFTAREAKLLHDEIIGAIIPALDHATADRTPFEHLATFASGGYYAIPVELFTINYDLLIESGLEARSVPYFDGFVGHLRGRFKPDLIDPFEISGAGSLPSSFVRLWKLHGSVNWEEEMDGDYRRVVRLGSVAQPGATAAIFPSDEKYDRSRRVPFVVLMDRLRRALAMQETLTLVSGYSFADQHLNEMLFDAARAYPRSETTVLCYQGIPDELGKVAEQTRNLSVYGRAEAIIGGRRGPWDRGDDVSGVWEGKEFLLGDFAKLALFLATQARLTNAAS